jgi:divalent metal cation (Fe/Co/Zn/Cd) transporter
MATGWWWLDPVIAIAVALNIMREGVAGAGARRRADGPGPRAAGDREIDKHAGILRHPTIRFDHVVTRRAGQRRFVDLHMHMPASWSLGRAAACAPRSSRR